MWSPTLTYTLKNVNILNCLDIRNGKVFQGKTDYRFIAAVKGSVNYPKLLL